MNYNTEQFKFNTIRLAKIYWLKLYLEFRLVCSFKLLHLTVSKRNIIVIPDGGTIDNGDTNLNYANLLLKKSRSDLDRIVDDPKAYQLM